MMDSRTKRTLRHADRVKHVRQAVRYYKQRVPRLWREMTAGSRMLPSFIIAGAPKCGTTALHWYLLSHPQVLAHSPPGWEIGYFSGSYGRGLDWYRAWFPSNIYTALKSKYTGKDIVTGEHTPFYVMHPLAAERIAATLPRAKIIILLRNPVDRAYSHYQHEFRSGHETLSFRDAIASEAVRTTNESARMQYDPDYQSTEYTRHAYLGQGEYLAKLKPFFNHLCSKNIMIVNSDRFFAQTQQVYDDVVTFLGLDRFILKQIKPINAGSYPPLSEADPELARELRKHFEPHNESLYSYLGVNFGW